MNNTGLNDTEAESRAGSELARAHSENVVRSAGVVSISVLVSRVSGLVRESFMARMFGAGLIYDAFIMGFRIPNLMRDLFAEGALSSAFVPVFSEYLATRSKEEAARLANLVASALILIVGTLCALGAFFAPQIVHFFAPGFSAVPAKFELAVTMTRIMFPFLLLVALAAQAMGVLNASNMFGVPAMASTFFNLGSVAFGVLLGVLLGPTLGISRIEGMAIGIVAGGALQLVWQLPALYRLGYRFRPAFDWSDPGLRRILRMMGPAILGSAAVQINVFVSTNFASGIVDARTGLDGPVSWLGYAFRFMQLPLGLFGVALGSATLPSISRSVASGNMDEFRRTVSQSLGMVCLLTLPSSLGLVVLGKSIIGAIYQTGRFTPYDTQQTALALSCYAIGLTGYAALKVINPAFYALGDARTPMWVSLGSILVNYGASTLMIRQAGMGHQALALSTSAVALFAFVWQFTLLRSRIHGVHGRWLLKQTARIAAASLAMAAAAALSSHWMESWLGISQRARLADIAVSLPLAAGIYYGACRWLGVKEIDLALRAFSAPVRRRLQRA